MDKYWGCGCWVGVKEIEGGLGDEGEDELTGIVSESNILNPCWIRKLVDNVGTKRELRGRPWERIIGGYGREKNGHRGKGTDMVEQFDRHHLGK